MIKVPFKTFALFSLALLLIAGCNKTIGGGAIGAGAGGLLGGVIGKQSGHTKTGAVAGAVIGGAAGAIIGHYMDKQAEEMKQNVDGAQIDRVGDEIKVTMASGILFKTNSYDLQSEAKQNIEKMAAVLNKYPDTNIIVTGHTDSDGTEELNQKLSERRSDSVANYLKIVGVSGLRITTVGYGETKPVAANDTAENKQKNRRVEVSIKANEKLIKDAESGKEPKTN